MHENTGIHIYNLVRKYKAQMDSEMEIHYAWQMQKNKEK
jgi:hypothetical protein